VVESRARHAVAPTTAGWRRWGHRRYSCTILNPLPSTPPAGRHIVGRFAAGHGCAKISCRASPRRPASAMRRSPHLQALPVHQTTVAARPIRSASVPANERSEGRHAMNIME